MGVARAWSRWPTETFSPSLMHTVNDYLSDVGSKKALSIMVLEISLPPNGSLCYHSIYIIYIYIIYYICIYIYLPLTFMCLYMGAGKFREYTHFIETSSMSFRDMLGHS